MGNLVKMPLSEVMATLEALDRCGLTIEDFVELRSSFQDRNSSVVEKAVLSLKESLVKSRLWKGNSYRKIPLFDGVIPVTSIFGFSCAFLQEEHDTFADNCTELELCLYDIVVHDFLVEGEEYISGEELLKRLMYLKETRISVRIGYSLWLNYQACCSIGKPDESVLEWARKFLDREIIRLLGDVFKNPTTNCRSFAQLSFNGSNWVWEVISLSAMQGRIKGKAFGYRGC